MNNNGNLGSGSTDKEQDCDRNSGDDSEEKESKLKLMSWNINGLKTLNMQDVLKQLDCSILAVQETKLTRKQLDQSQIIPPGYSSYFSFSSSRIGYSGVATYCSDQWSPMNAEEGLSLLNEDGGDLNKVGGYPKLSEEYESHVKFANSEGRAVITQHLVLVPDGEARPLTVINVYCPRLRDDPEDEVNNTEYKAAFHTILHERAKLLVESGSFVIIVGDINISHKWIDHCDGDPATFLKTEFRQLLDDLLASGFVDSFRHLNPNKESAFTCWNTKLNARANNYGTRIDYIFVDKQLSTYLKKAEIHPEILGSDHCPISATFHSLSAVLPETLPQFATKYYPEFKAKQTNLKELFMQQSTSKSASYSQKESSSSRKRPLDESAKTTKVQASKRVQLSLNSFFSKSNPTPDLKKEQNVPDIPNSSSSQSSHEGNTKRENGATDAWRKLMKAPEVPLCQGHKEPCTRRTVRKKGANFGREFWSCSHGVGKSDDPNANCNFFQWVKSAGSTK